MALYKYIKHETIQKNTPKSKYFNALPIGLMTLGLLMLLWVSWPILSFQLISGSVFAGVIAPISDEAVESATNLSPKVLAAENSDMADFTDANRWYPNSPQKKVTFQDAGYSLSIPVLGIDGANVVVGSDSLDKSLIHYGGTALPGEYGNAVIFGHSTLPALFNPKDYHTIFSLLPKLKVKQKTIPGDFIYIQFDGIRYKYEVYDMVITKPNDLTPLEQKFDDSRITLITCVPPGTYWERLNVKAKLVQPE